MPESTSLLRRRIPKRYVFYPLVLGYILLMTFGGCADKLILFPSTNPIDAAGALPRTIPFNGGVLEIYTARSPGCQDREPESFILEFTGNASRAEHVAAYTAWRMGKRPVEVWMVNYPGYGRSTGPAKLASIPPAALAAYDAIKSVAVNRPVYICGNSIGTTAALYTAAKRPCAGMVLQNPPPLRNMILTRFGWWNLWLLAGPIAMQVPSELDSPTNAPNVTVPAIFLLADSDDVVPMPYKQKVVDAYAGPKKVIVLKNAGHNDPLDGTGMIDFAAAIDWLWSRPEIR